VSTPVGTVDQHVGLHALLHSAYTESDISSVLIRISLSMWPTYARAVDQQWARTGQWELPQPPLLSRSVLQSTTIIHSQQIV